jgi:integrase
MTTLTLDIAQALLLRDLIDGALPEYEAAGQEVPYGPAVKARERLAGWVRELGVDDPAVAPNHGWRHSFKRRAARAGIEPRIRDAVCGHASRTQAERYELPTVEDMSAALIKFPRREV